MQDNAFFKAYLGVLIQNLCRCGVDKCVATPAVDEGVAFNCAKLNKVLLLARYNGAGKGKLTAVKPSAFTLPPSYDKVYAVASSTSPI